jgi:hypothetical protein
MKRRPGSRSFWKENARGEWSSRDHFLIAGATVFATAALIAQLWLDSTVGLALGIVCVALFAVFVADEVRQGLQKRRRRSY